MTPTPTITFTDERLDNGLRLVLAEDHLAPVVAVNLWYDVGSRNEKDGRTGLAHLFEHMMFQGSRHVAKGDHFKVIESGGGSLNASTWLHRTNYFEHGPSNQLELYLWLEADRMGGLLDALGQETLDNQRDVVKNEKRQRYDNAPYGTWWLHMIELLFPQAHPYGHPTIGSMEDLGAVSVQDCHEFFSMYYAPNNAVLSIAGDFDPNQARDWVERYYAGIPAHPAIPPTPDATIGIGLGGEQREVVHDKVPLPRVYAGFRAPPAGTPEADALIVAATLLAAGDGAPSKGTRLHRRLVRTQIAQDAEFWVQEFQGCSVVGGSATVRSGTDIADLESAFFDAIESLAAEPPGEDEMQRARAAIERRTHTALQRAASRADLLSEHAMMFGDPGVVNDVLPRLLAVTPQRIVAAARDVFRPDNRAVLHFLPEGA